LQLLKEQVMSPQELRYRIVGLKPGIHEFEYEYHDKFFVAYQEQDFQTASPR